MGDSVCEGRFFRATERPMTPILARALEIRYPTRPRMPVHVRLHTHKRCGFSLNSLDLEGVLRARIHNIFAPPTILYTTDA
jgi:hypothetical protein